MGRNYSNKNLTELELGNIEFYLNDKKGFTEIGRLLNKDESTIRKEVKNYSSFCGEKRKCSNVLNVNIVITLLKFVLIIRLLLIVNYLKKIIMFVMGVIYIINVIQLKLKIMLQQQ